MRTNRLAFLVAGLVACVRPAQQADVSPIVTDRPDFTESAVTVPHRSVQVEMGSTYSNEEGVKSLSSGEALIRAGLSPRVELRLTAANYAVQRASSARAQGLEDAGIGFKLALHDGGEEPSVIPTVGLIVGTSLPTGAEAFRSRRALPEAKLLGAWTINDRVAFASNVNWARTEDGSASFNEFSGSGSFAFSLSDRFGAYAEYYAFGGGAAAWTRSEYVNGGLTFLVHPTFQLDARVGLRIDTPADGTFVGLGISRRF